MRPVLSLHPQPKIYMDNISRENNSSFLPMAGVIVGAIALLIGGIALAKASKAATEETVTAQAAQLTEVATQARDAAAKADRTAATTAALDQGVRATFEGYAKIIEDLRTNIKTLQDAAVKKPVAGPAGPVVAGKDEYVVKANDVGSSIAKATGFNIAQLEAVNPGINWTKLRVGQKIKLPAKK